MERLRSGKIEAITSQPPFSDQLEKEGYPIILDPNTVFPRRPGKLTVASGTNDRETRRTNCAPIFARSSAVFWFMRDVKNFEYLRDLEKKLRKIQHPQRRRARCGRHRHRARPGWKAGRCPSTAASPRSVQRIADDMVKSGKLSKPISAKDILRDDAVKQAYREVSGRAELKGTLWNRAGGSREIRILGNDYEAPIQNSTIEAPPRDYY